ncbi:MAG: hypothetical protein QG608_566 [Actinomycetota bacterium]|nr:hypothetical protein [Actinomycetota bacterium]
MAPEIARVPDIPPGTVKSRTHCGTAELRRILLPLGVGHR